ncbi:MAG: hypothetical protein KDN20_06385 [Verrucomicrobiae bacterium]|nr:hypothetical protein [Verrucomicrobiae bacterium]
MICLLGLAGAMTADAEIVERDLGTDAQGNPVTGYVFQSSGRQSRVSSARRSSGLSSRRVVVRPSRNTGRIDRSYSLPYWYVPVIPLHCGSGFSIWHGGSSSNVSITVIR